MLADNLTLGNGDGSTTTTFNKIATKGDDVVRVDNQSPLNAPNSMVSRYNETGGKGRPTVRKPNVSFIREFQDSTHQAFATVTLTATVPDDILIDVPDIVKGIGNLIAFFTGVNTIVVNTERVEAWLRGEL